MLNFPVTFPINDFSISLHLITEILAFFLGYQLYFTLRKTKGDSITSDHRFIIILVAGVGALIGSRFLGALENPTALFQSRPIHETLIGIYQSKTILGGLLGGLIGVEMVKKLLGVNESSGDLFTLPIILGMIIGRVGCFSQGVFEPTYGLPTTFFTGMDLGDGLKRHPTSLYEIIFLCALFLFLWKVFQNNYWKNGQIFKWFMILYLLFRLLVGFIQPRELIVWQLGTLQIASVFGILYYKSAIISAFKSLIYK